jgi:hypothetical protein
MQSYRVTPCECADPGWCERHQCQKVPHWHLLCQTSEYYYQRWEGGRGPCLNHPPVNFLQSNNKPLPKCRHRGTVPIELLDCELCGGRHMKIAVYTCQHFGRCTERRYGTRTTAAREMPTCLRCELYEPNDGTQPIAAQGNSTTTETTTTLNEGPSA